VLEASIGQFLGAKWAWYASMAFWIVLLLTFSWYTFAIDFAHGIIWLDPWAVFCGTGLKNLSQLSFRSPTASVASHTSCPENPESTFARNW
jgi:hypothetical protein